MGSIRILLVNSTKGIAGGLTSSVDLALGLRGLGHDMIVACHPRSVLVERLRARDVRTETIGIRAEINVWRAVQLSRMIARVRPDVIIADRRKDVKFSFAALRMAPGPALIHRNGAPSPIRDSPFNRAIWTRLDGMIVNSEFMRRMLLERTPWIGTIAIDVIHNGKDMGYWKPLAGERATVRAELGIPPDAFVVAFHGVLQGRKKVDQLIRGCAAMRRPAHALIIGDGPDREQLEQLASELSVCATFTGHRTDLPRALSAGDVLAHLSAAEGFANSVVEGLACGLPVVASNATSHVEQIDEGVTGYLVEASDANAVAAKLDSLRDDDAMRDSMSRAARRQAASRFNLPHMVEQYSQVLLRAAKNP